jgi:spore coat polysaccharide biosynthesis protein SpsF
VTVLNKSLYDFDIPSASYDFVFTKGVLIHLDPSTLDVVYKKLVGASNRYVLIAEYYNRTPVSIPYRGHRDKLFKRDFAGELLDQYSDLRLVDYGFSYHRDRAFPQDDISWFLLQKNPS